METFKKISLCFLMFILIFQPITTSVYATSNTEQTDEQGKGAIIISYNDEAVPLFKDSTNSSEILANLLPNDEILILNELESFSHIQYENEFGEIIQGYIDNNNLELVKSETSENNHAVDDSDVIDFIDKDNAPDHDSNSKIKTKDSDESEVSEDATDIVRNETDSEKNKVEDNTIKEENPEEDSSNTEFEESNKTDTQVTEDAPDSKEEAKSKSNSLTAKKTTTTIQEQTVFHGIAINNPTHVYAEQSTNSSILKSYSQGSSLKYKSLNSQWYEAIVYVNGKYTTGYIHKSDVEQPVSNQKTLKGIATSSPTKVYSKTSTSSKVLKSYTEGTLLKYKSFTSNWFEATVYVNGKYTTGYIHKSDMEQPVSNQESLKGIATSAPTKVYSKTSTSSKVLKSYTEGTLLKYKSFTSNWFEATVYVNGKYTTGYIHKSDVEQPVSNQESLKGIATSTPTKVYSKTSTSSKVLKSYAEGSLLKYKSFTSNWFEATVYVNGKYTTGYIHKSDVEQPVSNQESLKGIATSTPTKVYSKTSTSSKVLKSYAEGSLLKYKSFTSNWFEATVYVNGKYTTGYIHKSDVEQPVSNQETFKGIATNAPTKVYSKASTSSKVLKSYAEGSLLKYKSFTSNWFEATVYVNGKYTTGYIHRSDVEVPYNKQETLNGWALKSPTSVYLSASRTSKVIKKYNQYSSLKFKTYLSNWYEATVYVNGKYTTGYIHVNDITFDDIAKKTEYNLTLNEALNIQLGASPQTDSPYAYVSKTYIGKNNKVTADLLNVRSGPSTNKKTLGQLTKGTSVDIIREINGWYQIKYRSNQWVDASPSDILYYLDPTNFLNNEEQRFQFLDLTKTSGTTVTSLNNYLKGKGTLANQGQAFIDAGNLHGINEMYLVSHAILETGNGSSTLAKGVKYNGVTVYNMFGIGAYDSCPVDCGAERAYKEGWTTPYKAIVGGANFIGNSYVKSGLNTLYKMRWNPEAMANTGNYGKQYATDIGWASKQIYTLYDLYKELDSYVLNLDIPSYKK